MIKTAILSLLIPVYSKIGLLKRGLFPDIASKLDAPGNK
jgi:hypothetical protein